MGPFRDGWTEEDVEVVLRRGDPAELLYVPIVVSMDPPDFEWAQGICIRLAAHSDHTVRGNAILGFGHLARTCRRLDESVVRPLIESALHDTHRYVRGQAFSAADDVKHYLKWSIEVPV